MAKAQLPRVDVAYVLITDEQGKKVLMVRNEKSWSLPGGRREKGETFQEAAIREVKEETGLDVELDGVVSVRERFAKYHDLFITFQGRIIGGEIKHGIDPEIQQVEWKSFQEAQELMPYVGDLKTLLSKQADYCVEEKKDFERIDRLKNVGICI